MAVYITWEHTGVQCTGVYTYISTWLEVYAVYFVGLPCVLGPWVTM